MIIYDPATGRILRSVTCADKDKTRQIQFGEAYIDGEGNDATQYVHVPSKTRAERPVMMLNTNGISHTVGTNIMVTNIPIGTKVILPFEAGETIVNDGFIGWTAMVPGVYTVHFQNFPYQEHYLDAEFTSL